VLEPGKPVCFLNSSVERLAEFLSLYRRWTQACGKGEDVDRAAFEAMEAKMRSRDPTAF